MSRQSHALENLGKLHQVLVLHLRGPVSGNAEVQCRRGIKSKRSGHRLSKRQGFYKNGRHSGFSAIDDMALGVKGGRDGLRNAGGSHQGSLSDRIRRGIDLSRTCRTQGSPGHKGGKPRCLKGHRRSQDGSQRGQSENPSATVVSRGSMAHWSIADRERVRIGLRRKGKGQHLGGAIVAKANSLEKEGRQQVSQ